MATVTEPLVSSGPEIAPFLITSDMFEQMIEQQMIPQDRRVFLWGGRLYEKMAKTLPHAAVHAALNSALSRRLPPGLFLWNENPIRLDETHLPLPDLVVARGAPLDFYDSRYPDGRDVVLVIEVAMSSLPEDIGIRLSRYGSTLPSATYVVVDIKNHQVLIHTGPRATGKSDEGTYAERTVVRAGEAIRLKLAGVELEPIPYEEVMR